MLAEAITEWFCMLERIDHTWQTKPHIEPLSQNEVKCASETDNRRRGEPKTMAEGDQMVSWMKTLLLSVAAALVPLQVLAQEALPDSVTQAIDAIMNSELERDGCPGASVAVVLDGKFRWASGYGVIDLDSRTPTTPDTVFRIASISKMLTATAQMQLVESGAVSLNAPAREYCPELPRNWGSITVHHLLSHQSGIRHWRTSAERYNQVQYPSIASSIDVVRDSALLFPPGTAEEYSTPAYNVVGCVIAGASGTSYGDYMRENVFGPSGMSNVYIGDAPQDHPNSAKGYRDGPDGPRPSRPDDLSIKYPGGGLSASASDLALFTEALFQGKLLKQESLDIMWTVKRLANGEETDKGYGCNIGEEKGRRVVWHIGGVSGFCGNLYIYPARQAAVAVLFNLEAQNVFPTASAIMDELIK